MRKIYRYELDLDDEPKVAMPVGARVLSVSTQRGRLECWAVVDPDQPVSEMRAFCVVGTGHPVPDDCGRFLGTVMVSDGALVFHVFEATHTL